MGKSPAQEMAAKLRKTKDEIAAQNKKDKGLLSKDKAFGMKNQKGAQTKLNVDQLRAQAAKEGRTKEQIKKDEEKAAKQRADAEIRKQRKANGGLTNEEMLLGKTVVAVKSGPTLDPNVDPKTLLCEFFKKGKCKKKGNKCKFSHDLSIEHGAKAKMNLYEDLRATDTMDKWDQEKLEMVVGQKDVFRPNATKIVCKHFIDAIEQKKYGWFWKCESGKDCMYQHKLPPGFILKTDMDAILKEEELPIEEQIEIEREKLDRSKLTLITPETFAVWKKAQLEKKLADRKEEVKIKVKAKGGNKTGMSGRNLFAYDPSIFVDDADAADDKDYEEQEGDEAEGDEEEGEKQEETETKDWAPSAAFVEEDLLVEDMEKAALEDDK